MNLSSFKHSDWTKIYEGRWSFLTSTHFIDHYTRLIKFGGRPFKSQSIILVAKGWSSGWMRQSDRDILGRYLSSQVVKNPRSVKTLSNKLKTEAKHFLKFIDQKENTVATLKLYEDFWRRLLAYYHPHINVKYVVDYLRPDLLEKHLSELESARLAAEPVLNRTEDFMVSFAKLLSKKTKYNYQLLLCLTQAELENYFRTGKLPAASELQARNKRAALVADKKSFAFYTGKQADKVEALLAQSKNNKLIKGSSAYAGKVVGTVRIVLDPKNAKNFRRGDILVAGSTRPEYLPIMHKASAFVTDAGGILSHAAITARELRKPCVIGTQVATKILKDGNKVEVDATKGVVKILK